MRGVLGWWGLGHLYVRNLIDDTFVRLCVQLSVFLAVRQQLGEVQQEVSMPARRVKR